MRRPLEQLPPRWRQAARPYRSPNGGPVATATVNVTRVSERLLEDEVCVKDSSENEGMLDALTAAGIIEETGRRVKIGCVTVPVVKLLDGSGT